MVPRMEPVSSPFLERLAGLSMAAPRRRPPPPLASCQVQRRFTIIILSRDVGPFSSSSRTTASCPFSAARCSALCFVPCTTFCTDLSFAATSAPFSSSSRTTASYPFSAALYSAVSPSSSVASTSAPSPVAAAQPPHTRFLPHCAAPSAPTLTAAWSSRRCQHPSPAAAAPPPHTRCQLPGAALSCHQAVSGQ